MHLLSSKFPMFLDVASFYSHILIGVFNYIFQVVKQQGIDSTEDQDDYGMDDYDDIKLFSQRSNKCGLLE